MLYRNHLWSNQHNNKNKYDTHLVLPYFIFLIVQNVYIYQILSFILYNIY